MSSVDLWFAVLFAILFSFTVKLNKTSSSEYPSLPNKIALFNSTKLRKSLQKINASVSSKSDPFLGGGFKIFLFPPLPGEDSQSD